MAECPEGSKSCKETRSGRTSRTRQPPPSHNGVVVLGAKNKGNNNRIVIDGDTVAQNRGNLKENENMAGLIVIKGDHKTKEIILNNIDIDAANLYANSRKNKALIVVEAEKGTKITANNIRINAKKINFTTRKNNEKDSFSSLIHFQTGNSNIDASNIRVNTNKTQLKSIK